eukprot:12423625-Karenia_brevis.AAC.1
MWAFPNYVASMIKKEEIIVTPHGIMCAFHFTTSIALRIVFLAPLRLTSLAKKKLRLNLFFLKN